MISRDNTLNKMCLSLGENASVHPSTILRRVKYLRTCNNYNSRSFGYLDKNPICNVIPVRRQSQGQQVNFIFLKTAINSAHLNSLPFVSLKEVQKIFRLLLEFPASTISLKIAPWLRFLCGLGQGYFLACVDFFSMFFFCTLSCEMM